MITILWIEQLGCKPWVGKSDGWLCFICTSSQACPPSSNLLIGVSNVPTQSTLCFYQSWDLFEGNLCRKDLSTVVHRPRCVRTTARHIVVGNFSISRNKDYGCGSPRTDITTHIIADCSISYPSSSRSMQKAYIGISFFFAQCSYKILRQAQISRIVGPRRIVGGSADGFIARVCHCIQEKTLRLCYK